ncbi:MAG: hypothetical protein HYZ28_15870 [Myxococcales bacterium]|nr:hypothetical protein [Myxococcales bacterium]
MAADAMKGTRLVLPKARLRPPARAELGFAEQVALFCAALDREGALELLDGLAEPLRSRARTQAREAMSWDSATRQARLQLAYGERPEAVRQLREAMSMAGPALRQEVFRLLPVHLKSLFPEQASNPAGDPACPVLAALARRIVREACH